MVDENRIKGAAKTQGGKLKEHLGRAVGDEKIEREGQTDQVKGKVENIAGGIKDKLREKDRPRE